MLSLSKSVEFSFGLVPVRHVPVQSIALDMFRQLEIREWGDTSAGLWNYMIIAFINVLHVRWCPSFLNCNVTTNSGVSALSLANTAERGQCDVVRMLIQHGPAYSTVGNGGSSALFYAGQRGHLSSHSSLSFCEHEFALRCPVGLDCCCWTRWQSCDRY